MDPRLAELLDKQEIEEVVLRYCRGIDRRDFDLVRACYHRDAIDRHGSFEGSVDAFVEWVDGLTAKYEWSMHLVGNVLVELGAPDRAACETLGVALHRGRDAEPTRNLATGFRYLDRFERRDGRWRIAERNAIGVWSLPVPADAWWSIPETHAQGRRDERDPLYALLAEVGVRRSF